jgi:hypothetical protein
MRVLLGIFKVCRGGMVSPHWKTRWKMSDSSRDGFYYTAPTARGNIGVSYRSQEDADENAREMDDNGCQNCYYCIDCRNCKNCEHCIGCADCDNCHGCEGCRSCSDCSGCDDCAGCNMCSGCIDCHGCYRCMGRVGCECSEFGDKRVADVA